MAHYLKVMKLRIQYTEIHYVKIKLRTLLKQLGYKRRSDKLLMELNDVSALRSSCIKKAEY